MFCFLLQLKVCDYAAEFSSSEVKNELYLLAWCLFPGITDVYSSMAAKCGNKKRKSNIKLRGSHCSSLQLNILPLAPLSAANSVSNYEKTFISIRYLLTPKHKCSVWSPMLKSEILSVPTPRNCFPDHFFIKNPESNCSHHPSLYSKSLSSSAPNNATRIMKSVAL